MIRHIIVTGKVQGVFFRYHAEREAKSNGLKGTVKNLPDGSVEIYASGADSQLESFKKWCKIGSPASRVDRVLVKEVFGRRDYEDFRVIF